MIENGAFEDDDLYKLSTYIISNGSVLNSNRAKKILEAYNGVFLADVVGLGNRMAATAVAGGKGHGVGAKLGGVHRANGNETGSQIALITV